MTNSIPMPRRSLFHLLAVLLMVGLLIVVSAPAGAAPAERSRGPHTPVSSDGFEAPRSEEGTIRKRGQVYIEASEGSEAIPEGASTTISGDEDRNAGPVVAETPEGIESVIGTDGRYRITNTTTYPYRAIAHVTSSIGGCTGWLINANTVVTAGHCVYNNGWASNVRVYPGRNASVAPYGSCGATRLFTVTGWATNRDPQYDYGAIKLNCTIGNSTGWFGYRWQSDSLTGQPTYLSGYPGDKTYGTQWRHDDQVRVTQTRRIFYANDTFGGQSGSPVWNNSGSCNTCGIAIHAYGVGSTGYNGGTRITRDVFDNLTNWRNS